jgi:hypothetical protein
MINAVSIPAAPRTPLAVVIPVENNIGQDVLMVNAISRGRHWIPFMALISRGAEWGDFEFGPGYVSRAYVQQWFLDNVSQPVVYTLIFGSLPPGLALYNLGSTALGEISGIPTQAGTFHFTLRATSPDMDDSKAFTIVIELEPPPPPGGTAYVGGN